MVLTTPRCEEVSGRIRMPSYFFFRELEKQVGRSVTLEELSELKPLSWVSAGSWAPERREDATRRLEEDLFDVLEGLRGGSLGAVAAVLERSPFGAAAIAAEHARWETEEFTAYDGVLALLPAELRA